MVDLSDMTASADDSFDFFSPQPSAGASASDAAAASFNLLTRVGQGPASPLPSALPNAKQSRWVKSDTTFGPVGRMVARVAMFLPFVLLVAGALLTFDPFVFVGVGIWGFLMVKGFRQVWQPVHHLHRR